MHKIEKEITREIARVHRYFSGYVEKYLLKQYQLNISQAKAILYLHNHSGASQDQISEEMVMDKSAVARIGKHLEKQNYIERKQNQIDKRAYQIYLTKEGREIYNVIVKLLREWDDIVRECLSEEEERELYVLLEKVASKLKEKREEKKKKTIKEA